MTVWPLSNKKGHHGYTQHYISKGGVVFATLSNTGQRCGTVICVTIQGPLWFPFCNSLSSLPCLPFTFPAFLPDCLPRLDYFHLSSVNFSFLVYSCLCALLFVNLSSCFVRLWYSSFFFLCFNLVYFFGLRLALTFVCIQTFPLLNKSVILSCLPTATAESNSGTYRHIRDRSRSVFILV